MLPWFLLAVGMFWVILGATRTTGFSGFGSQTNEIISKMFFIFGFYHIAIAIFLTIAPVPFGALLNQSVSVATNYTPTVFNTTTYSYNTSGLTGNSTIGNLYVNQTNSSKTVTFAYNIFGEGLVSFFSYAYFLLLFIYLFLFSWALFKRANKPLHKSDDDDEED